MLASVLPGLLSLHPGALSQGQARSLYLDGLPETLAQ